ncbi:MAG: helix-turn-helix domain-containing protein [Deltaproteobacteria bacterium]|nr:helix-turn-helix domain-containing protein [Deltaproteobacteria bacterium]
MIMELSEVLTVAEVATVLRVDRKTIYEAIRRKQLPAKRVGRRRLVVSRDALVAWLRS